MATLLGRVKEFNSMETLFGANWLQEQRTVLGMFNSLL